MQASELLYSAIVSPSKSSSSTALVQLRRCYYGEPAKILHVLLSFVVLFVQTVKVAPRIFTEFCAAALASLGILSTIP